MVQWVIAEVMADKSLQPEDIQTRYRRHSVYGWGTFKCVDCRLSWMSQITWVTLDLKEQRIRRRFKQKCKKCNKQQRPWWHVEEFAFMVEFAINRYRKLLSGTWKPAAGPPILKNNPPHKSELCERCNFGERKCWCVVTDGDGDGTDSSPDKIKITTITAITKVADVDAKKAIPTVQPAAKENDTATAPQEQVTAKPKEKAQRVPRRRRERRNSSRTESISKDKMNGIEEENEAESPQKEDEKATKKEAEDDKEAKPIENGLEKPSADEAIGGEEKNAKVRFADAGENHDANDVEDQPAESEGESKQEDKPASAMNGEQEVANEKVDDTGGAVSDDSKVDHNHNKLPSEE